MAFGRTEPSVYRDEHAANMRHIAAMWRADRADACEAGSWRRWPEHSSAGTLEPWVIPRLSHTGQVVPCPNSHRAIWLCVRI